MTGGSGRPRLAGSSEDAVSVLVTRDKSFTRAALPRSPGATTYVMGLDVVINDRERLPESMLMLRVGAVKMKRI